MQFNIASYLENVERKLTRLQPPHRILFAAWCAAALMKDAFDYVVGQIGLEGALVVRDAQEFAWTCGLKGADASEIERWQIACASIQWDEAHVSDGQQLENFIAIEWISAVTYALETCMTGSAHSAAHAAERIINRLDYELSQEYEISYSEEVFADPRFVAELHRQCDFLEFLQSCPRPENVKWDMFRGNR